MKLTLAQRWNRFWFEPANPQTLGFCRFLVMLGAFFYYRTTDFESWGFVRHSFWIPIPLFEHLRWHPLGPLAMWTLGFIWKLSLFFAGIGLFTRISCAAAFFMGLYLVGLPNNLGKLDHNDGILLWSMLVLAIARSGDGWSLDRLLRIAFGPMFKPALGLAPAIGESEKHAEYRWPLRMMQVLMVVIFFAAGSSKLRVSGLRWAFSDNLRNTFLTTYYLGSPPLNWGWVLSHYPHVCWFLAFSSLMMECGLVLALFNRYARWIMLASLFLMQVGNELILGIKFRQFILTYAFWVEWSQFGTWLAAVLQSWNWAPAPVTVLFDGSCGLCQRTINIIRRLDLFRKVEVLDAWNDWAEVSARFPNLTQEHCMRTMHVIDSAGTVLTGFFGYRRLCRAVPTGWLMLPFLYVPGVPTIGERVYQKIADGRFSQGCGVDVAKPAA